MKKKIFVSHIWDASDIPNLPNYIKEMEAKDCEVEVYPYKLRLDTDDMKKWLPGCYAHICGSDEWSAEVMDALPEVKIISHIGVGFETVDIPAATERVWQLPLHPGQGQALYPNSHSLSYWRCPAGFYRMIKLQERLRRVSNGILIVLWLIPQSR